MADRLLIHALCGVCGDSIVCEPWLANMEVWCDVCLAEWGD